MNLVDCTVLEVLSEPYESYGLWCVSVKYDSWGSVSIGEIIGLTKEEAFCVAPGYVFQQ